MKDECECEYDGEQQLYQCEECHHNENDKCSCKEDHIDLNCRECF